MKALVLTFLVGWAVLGAMACQDQSVGHEGVSAAKVSERQQTVLEVLAPADFAVKMAGDVQLIDVRRPEEYAAGHIEGAVNYNFLGTGFNKEVVQLDKNKPVLLYCRTGKRSGAASRKMQAMGFSEVYDLQGGYLNWSKSQRAGQ